MLRSLRFTSRTPARPILAGLIGVFALAACGGCQMAYFLTDPDKTEEVKAEYGKIGDRTVAILVWADRSTLDIYPRTRYRIGKAVEYWMKKNLPEARFVRAEEVRRLQEGSGANWEGMTARQLCERLKCDMVLRVDLLEYTTRASGTRELRKGRVRATANLYDGGEKGGEEAVYETVVLATYPPKSWHGVPDMDENQILHETVETFAQETARKFYDHGVLLREKPAR